MCKMLASKNIIKREEEFLKLNAEIDLQTKNLMTQVDFLKEIQSNTSNLYSNWDKTGVTLLSESNNNEEENQYDIAALFEDTYNLKDCLAKTQTEVENEISADNETLEKVKKKGIGTLDAKKDKIKRHSTLSHSAKTSSYVMNTTVLGQDLFPSTGLTRHKSDVKLKQGMDSEVLPESLKGIGHEGMMRFLTAKVKLLTEQVITMQKDEKQHMEKIKELQSARDKLTEEKEKLIQQANMTKNLLVKCEQQTNNIALQLQTTQAENGNLKKELEILKKEVRQSNQNCNTNELKLNRALEEVEKLKGTLQQVKQDEKELKELHRRKTDDLSSTVKRLDKQRVELLNAFKKQLLIINNLKRQKGLSEACKLLKCAEEDFNNFLECNPRTMVNQVDFIKNSKT